MAGDIAKESRVSDPVRSEVWAGLKNSSCEVDGDSTGWRRARDWPPLSGLFSRPAGPHDAESEERRQLKRSDGKAQAGIAPPL